MRVDQRKPNQLREIHIEPNYLLHAEGSVLITIGQTKVICTATVEEKVPPFMRGQGKGWITAEYAMLPRATEQRNVRESTRGKVSGRTMEIQRLIGRSLRSILNLDLLGERTIWLDCDVIQADGGTRTASITGAFVALALAVEKLMEQGKIGICPIKDFLAATSVGILEDDSVVLDLNYAEDSQAKVDMNVVMTGQGEFVEIQGTGEEHPFSKAKLEQLLALGELGIQTLMEKQKAALGAFANQIGIKKVMLATTNQGKVKEFQDLLLQLNMEVVTPQDLGLPAIEVEENGTSFTANALLKARAYFKEYGLPAIADDSGLEVDALGGKPGIYSARYAGEDKDDQANIDKVLQELKGVTRKERTARFRCAIAYIDESGQVLTEGTCDGLIAEASQGNEGFGYDPIFYLPNLSKTMAQLSKAEKNSLSHRYQALQNLLKKMQKKPLTNKQK